MNNRQLNSSEMIDESYNKYLSGHHTEMENLFNSITNPETLVGIQKIKYDLINGFFILNKGDYVESENIVRKAISRALDSNNFDLSLDGYIILIDSYERQEKYDESIKLFTKGNDLFGKILSTTLNQNLFRKKALLLIFRGRKNWWNFNSNSALKLFTEALELAKKEGLSHEKAIALRNIALVLDYSDKEHSFQYQNEALSIFRDLNNPLQIAWSLQNLAETLWTDYGNFILAITYLDEALAIREKFGNKYWIYFTLLNYATLYEKKGELDLADEYYQKCSQIANEFQGENVWRFSHFNLIRLYIEKGDIRTVESLLFQAGKIIKRIEEPNIKTKILYFTAHLFRLKGEFEKALEILEESISLKNNNELYTDDLFLSESHIWGIILATQIKNNQIARKHFEKIPSIIAKNKDRLIIEKIQNDLNFGEAIILKNSGRMRDKVKAQDFFEKVLTDSNNIYWFKDLVVIYLCEMYFEEYSTFNDPQVFADLKNLVSTIQKHAEKKSSYFLVTKSILLKAKLYLIENDIVEGEKLLKEVKLLANEKNLTNLEQEATNELEELHDWKKLSKEPESQVMKLEKAQILDYVKEAGKIIGIGDLRQKK